MNDSPTVRRDASADGADVRGGGGGGGVGGGVADPQAMTSPAREFWFNYLAKPVFSAEWRRGRLRSLGSLCIGVYCLIAIALLAGNSLAGDLVHMFVGLFFVLGLPLVFGPALASRMTKSTGIDTQRGRRMLAALVFVSAAAVAADRWCTHALTDSVNNALGWKQAATASGAAQPRHSAGDDPCCSEPDRLVIRRIASGSRS